MSSTKAIASNHKTSDVLDDVLRAELDRLRSVDLFRQQRVITPVSAVRVEVDGRRCVNFSSNNYLGLTHHPRVREAVLGAVTSHGAGAGAAGLITGHTDLHDQAQRDLARWKNTEHAVLLPSGYQANLATIQTLAGLTQTSAGSLTGVRFLMDKLVHASLIDAVRATGTAFRVFPHNHLDKLRRLLQDAPANELQVVLTESIFSMDGDQADLVGLARLKREHPFVLVVDEAHGSGVYGEHGAGLGAELGVANSVDVTIVTLSKAIGCGGGAVCASKAFCDLLLNTGRAYIYSTAIPPSVAAGASAALGVMRDEPHHQQRVRDLARHVRDVLTSTGVELPPGDSPIIPIVIGEARDALRLAERLKEAGYLTLAIRPPTVAPGASRLRVTLSSAHSDEDVSGLLKVLKGVMHG